MRTRALTAACFLLLEACSTARDPATDAAPVVAPEESRVRGNSNVLTGAEVREQAVGAPDLFTAIARLRPQYLQARNTPNLRGQRDPIRVYIAAMPAGTIDALRGVRIEQVEQVRWMNGRDATTRYGTGHGAGAIIVLLR